MMPLDTADDDESSATLALAPFPPCSAGGGSWRGSEKGSPSAGAACLTFPDEISSHPDPDPDGTDAGRELAALSPAPRLPETGILGPAAAFAAAAGTGTGTGSSRADATTTAAWPDAVTRSTGSAAAAAAVDEGDGGGGAIGKEEEEEVLAELLVVGVEAEAGAGADVDMPWAGLTPWDEVAPEIPVGPPAPAGTAASDDADPGTCRHVCDGAWCTACCREDAAAEQEGEAIVALA